MPKTDKAELYLTQDEAIKEIRRRYRKGVTYFVHAGAFLYTEPSQGEPGTESFVPGRGFEGMCNVEVSQKAAIKYVQDCIGRVFAERGVKIKIHDMGARDNGLGGCIFIG